MRSEMLCFITLYFWTWSINLKAQSDPASMPPDIVIKNITMIPMTGSQKMIKNQTIHLSKGKITGIGLEQIPDGVTVVDGRGKYLMPGLTEMHAHIPVPREGDDTNVRETLFLYLSQGVTTIRGMLGNPYHLDLRTMVESGEVLGPRIYTSSPSINGNSVRTPEEARQKVTQYKADGYDFLKIHPGVQMEVWNEIEKTANEVDIAYAGHVPVDVGIHRALESRYASIDHLDGYIDGLLKNPEDVDPNGGGFFGYNFIDEIDSDKIKHLVQKTKVNGVAIVPTQTLFSRWFSPTDVNILMQDPEMQYLPSEMRFAWRQSKTRLTAGDYNPTEWSKMYSIRKKILAEMVEQDVIILLGSDAPQVMNVPGFSAHREMQDMVDGGMDTYYVLESGTSNPAKYFGTSGTFGTVTEGSSADLIILNDNPLDNIRNSTSIEGVFIRGLYMDRAEINQRLKEIALRHKN